ncbi:MAG: hypothetical protein IJ993_00460, partial [Akkermansia sp.]|nr:hypothetical protein [Akkermansia sp.]
MGHPINAVRRSSWRALPALHKPPQGGFFTTAQPFFTASISEPKTTEPAQQAQSHCCASAQQSHLSFRSNLTAA